MSQNYGEIFCDAVNQLIQSSLSTLNYDITKNCTVTNIDDRKCGKYQVFDGAIRFNAYAPNGVFYELNDSVLVTIPEGDFNKQATIINKIADPFFGSASYKSPFDTLLKGTGNICTKSTFAKLTANDETGSATSVTIIKDQEFFGFTKIGLQADFSALLKELNVVEGAYGLKLILYTEKNSKSSVMDFTFSSYDMFGNPYEFSSNFKQQIVFDIPQDLNCIKKIEVIFYQDNGFKNKDGKRIQPLKDPNLFVQNIEIYFGYDAGTKVEERVEISSSKLTYSDETEKLIHLKWFHQTSENTIQIIQPNDLEDDKYSVKWYQYSPGCSESEIDDYGGMNWKVLSSTKTKDYPLALSFKPSLTKRQEKIKAIVFVKNRPLTNDPTYITTSSYGSNILIFENSDNVTEGGTKYDEVVKNKLSLYFEDNSDGNYFFYDQNGCLINGTDNGVGQTRRISLKYGGEDIEKTNIFDKIRSITWQAPDDDIQYSMISYDRSNFKNPNENLIKNVDKENIENLSAWKTLSNDEKNLEESDVWLVDNETAIVVVPISKDESADAGIYTIVENNGVAGTYNFKSTIKVFSDQDDVSQIQLDQQVKVFLQIFIAKDESGWSQYPYNSKTFMINPLEESVINTSFSILQEHKKLKIVIGYSKDQEYNTLPDNPRFFIWLGKDDTKFQLDADSCVNTYYPIVDGNGKKTIQSYFDYSISTIWSQDRSNNFIQCSVDIDGQVHILHEILRFGPRGSSGTHNTFLLEMLDGKNALIVRNGIDELRVKAILLDAKGKEIKINDPENIKWNIINFNEEHTQTVPSSGQICTITKQERLSELPNNNYAILWAAYKLPDSTVSLHAFLPIPMKQAECVRMTGADRVIYNHLGTPNYSNISYVAYMSDENKTVIKNWELNSPKDVDNKFYISPNCPSLSTSTDGGEALVAAPLYSKGEGNGPIYDAVCVYCDYWSQPILIMQSNYDFAMLNEWDGSLTIDEKNNIILSSMIGAGKKDLENKFSGVLIGDLKGGTGLNDTEKMTGVYGFQNGIMSYALKEDGKAFFGADGYGRIEIDGTSGIIRSAGWKKKSENWILNPPKGDSDHDENIPVRSNGTLLDLDDGMLLMQSDNNYIYFNRPGHSGELEMSLSSMNIKLSDKDNNPSLSGYIDATTDKIRLEIARRASYYCRCLSNATNTSGETPQIKYIRFDEEAFKDLYNSKSSSWEIKKHIVITVLFDSGNEEKDIRFALCLDPGGNSGDITYVSSPYPVKVQFTPEKDVNALKCGKNETLSFIFDGESFILTDIGYSGIESSITQTADSIKLEVAQTANYRGTCKSGQKESEKWILIDNYSSIPEKILKGFTITVTFTYGNEAENLNFNLWDGSSNSRKIKVSGSPKWNAGETLSFVYVGVEDKIDNGFVMTSLSQTNLTQTATEIAASATAGKLDASGKNQAETFGWTLSSNGFILSSKIDNKTTNIFKCDKDGLVIEGSGNFSGNLTAKSTIFTELAIEGFYSSYEGKEQYYQTKINKNQIILAAEWTKSGAARAGQIYIGAPGTSSSFDDISIYAVPLSTHPANHGGYGNLGLKDYPWDMIYVKANESMRNVKEKVEVYNIDQAYEELKNLPIYTYNYQGNTESCRTRFLGTMIDYLPTETIRITPGNNTQYFEPTSLTYWNIAATQAIQQKLENLDNKMNLLEEQINGIN